MREFFENILRSGCMLDLSDWHLKSLFSLPFDKISKITLKERLTENKISIFKAFSLENFLRKMSGTSLLLPS